MNDDTKYIQQLDAHMDAGGTISPQNVREVIVSYNRAIASNDKLTAILSEAFERLNQDTSIHSGSFLHQDIMVALEDADAIEKVE